MSPNHIPVVLILTPVHGFEVLMPIIQVTLVSGPKSFTCHIILVYDLGFFLPSYILLQTRNVNSLV